MSYGCPVSIELLKAAITRGRSSGWTKSLLAQFFISSGVLPRYSRIWRLKKLKLTCGIHGTHQSGNAVDDPAETFFARAERLLEALPVVNIRS